MVISRLPLLAVFLFGLLTLGAVAVRALDDGAPVLQRQAIVPGLSREVAPAVTVKPPPPGPGYCVPVSGGPPAPPNTVIGLFTINGQPAPAGTLITLTFNGLPGPSAFTAAAGGYRVDYAAGGQGREPPCINEFGSLLGLLVDGVLTDTGVHVGDPVGYLLLIFNLHLTK